MESKFRVFNCGYFITLGQIYAVVTGEDKGSEIITEWYYIVLGENKKLNGLRITTSSVFESIDQFWNSETFTSLENAIFHKELFPSIKDKKDYYLYDRQINLKEIDNHSLFSINMENPEFIKYISNNTECTEFKEYEKLFKVITITRTSLPYEN